jgi:spermidine synthase
MSAPLARALVFSTSAAVLVLEILAGRLLAPYVGVTLETFTGIIGTVLAGISIGAWWGGRLADQIDPHRLLGPVIAAGGVLALAAPPLVHWIGPSLRAAGPGEIVLLTVVAFFLPAAALSAVTPIVVKIRLRNLDETGAVVGTFSAIGTAGAIFGTFITGFVLIAALPSRIVVAVVGALLIAAGAALWVRRGQLGVLAVVLVPAAIAGGLLYGVDGPCDTETTYYCAFVTVDETRESGRVLWLDTLRHSYVDLDDPTFLGFRYARDLADIAATLPAGPIDVLSIGGGGFTLPRYLTEARPGSTNTVLELDGSLVDVVEDQLGLDRNDPSLTVRVGDARVLLAREPARAYDLVIGDAFGGLSVPWHLTTEEFVTDIRERLRPGGIYVLNMIDYPPLDFARAEVATIATVFPHVTVIAPAEYLTGARGGNFVIAGADRPFDTEALTAAVAARDGGEVAISGDDVDEWVDGARVLTDDYAPVDQLISRP